MAAVTAAATLSMVAPPSVHAATVSWNNASGGSWSTPNWTGGVGANPPTSNDSGAFNLAATYSIDLNISPTVSGVAVGGSNVTFTNGTAGRTFTNNGTITVNSGSFTLSASNPVNWINNNTAFLNTNLTVNNGNDFSAPLLGIGAAGNSTASFSGAGTTLSVASGTSIGNGTGLSGTLTLSSTASGTTSTLNMATLNAGTANLNVQSGAQLAAQGLNMANSAVSGRVANATVTGTNSLLVNNGALNLGAASLSAATITISNNASLSTSGGDVSINSTGLLDIQSGGHVTVTNNFVGLSSGSGTQGKILVSGMNSSFTQTGGFGITVGGASGSVATIQTSNSGSFSTSTAGVTINAAGLVDVAAGGVFNLNGNATVNGTLQRSATGNFNWPASKMMTMQNGGDFLITGGYTLPNSASVTVTGAGSSLVQSGSGTLQINGGSTLNIAAGGTVSALSEQVAAGGNGTVAQSGGTHTVSGAATTPMVVGPGFGATGTYNLSGGILNVTNDAVGAPGEIIGNFGIASFVQSGGSHTVNGASGGLVIGAAQTGVGTYTLSNNAQVDCTSLDIARDAGATGTLTLQSGGNPFVIVIGGFVQLGMNLVGTGTINANSGDISSNGVFVGGTSTAAGGTGILNIAGGTVEAGSPNGSANSGQLRVWNTGNSAINLSGGRLSCDTLLTSGNPSRFHWAGTGRVDITGDGGFDISASGPLGANLTLDGGKQLFVTRTTNIAPGASVTLVGSSLFFTGSLTGNGALSSDLNNIFVGSDNTSTTFTGTITGDGGLVKNGTGTLTIAYERIRTVTVNDGTLKVNFTGGSNDRTSVAGFVNIRNEGRFDLSDNKLIVQFGDVGTASGGGGTYSGLSGMIQRAYDFGAWDHPGLTTSRPLAASGLTTLGIARADQLGISSFSGISLDPSDAIVMYTYAGDANLDGVIDGGDYGVIDNFAQVPGASGYANGDFNYDGVIDGGDYGIIDNNIQAQGIPWPTSSSVGGMSGVTAVPEPAGVLMLLAPMAAVLRRRRCVASQRRRFPE